MTSEPVRANKTKRKLRNGEIAFGVWISAPSPRLVEFCGLAEVDFVLMDLEHHPFHLQALENMVRAAELSGVTPLVRISSHEPKAISLLLDIGFQGFIAPGICSAAEARAVISAALFGPKGTRGFGRARDSRYGRNDTAAFVKAANEETLISLLIEHSDALAEIDEIVRVPGVDVIDIGPCDLSMSLGHPGDVDHPEVTSAIGLIIRTALSQGLVISNYIPRRDRIGGLISAGYKMLCVSIDELIVDRINDLKAEIRAAHS